jgi:hypothetical protein
MITKSSKTFRTTIALLSLFFLFSVSLPASAGSAKRAWKQQEQTAPARGDSGELNLPRPVADDSPINPVVNDRGRHNDNDKKHDQNKEQQKKRPRR